MFLLRCQIHEFSILDIKMICFTSLPLIVKHSNCIKNYFCFLCIDYDYGDFIIEVTSSCQLGKNNQSLAQTFLPCFNPKCRVLFYNMGNTWFQRNVHEIFLIISKVLIENTSAIISHSLQSKTNHLSFILQVILFHTKSNERYGTVKATIDIARNIDECSLFRVNYYNKLLQKTKEIFNFN